MTGYQGRLRLHVRIFLPNKQHAESGLKVWCLYITETGYTYSFELHQGEMDREDLGQDRATYSHVMHMMENGDFILQRLPSWFT